MTPTVMDDGQHTTAAAAQRLINLGFALCKPDPGEKKPTYRGWPGKPLLASSFREGDLIGIMGGPLSDGNKPDHALVIIDLDSAKAVEEADSYLPQTDMPEGRPGKPRSHRYYLVPVETIPTWAVSQAEQGATVAKEKKGYAGPFKKKFSHAETKACVIDFIGTGGQVVAPPSAHPSGEVREWLGGSPGTPAVLPFPDLWDAVCELARVCGCKIPPNCPPGKPTNGTSRTASQGGASDNIIRRAIAYLNRCDPAVSGERGHDGTFWAARCMCWGFDLGEEVGFQILRDHFNHRCQPLWSEQELRHKCRDADTLPYSQPRGWLRDTPPPERNNRPANGQENGQHVGRTPDKPVVFQLPPLTLRPDTAHRTLSGKVSVPLTILRDCLPVDHATLSSAVSGRAAVVKLLAEHLGVDARLRPDISTLFGQILAAAVEDLERSAGSDQLQLRNIVRAEILAYWRLTGLADRGGVWSEIRDAEVGRAEFLAFVPDWLLNAASIAADAPRTENGSINRSVLLHAVRTELEIIWADQLAQLPVVPDPNSDTDRAAQRFQSALEELFSKPRLNERIKRGEELIVVGGSLASFAANQWKKNCRNATGKEPWEQIQAPYNAWWRPGVDADGQLVPRLGFHWSLTTQIGVALPGVRNQTNLRALGRRFGVLDPAPDMPGKGRLGKGKRLAVLAVNFSQELLENPAEWVEESEASEPPKEGETG